MSGTRPFTYMQIGKETVAGTSVAATRMWYPDGAGMVDVDRMQQFHGGNRSTRTNTAHVTQQGIAVKIPYKSDPQVGAAFDEFPYIFSQIKGAATGVGAGADRTWTQNPNQTTANAQESYTIEVGDETQEFEVEYCQASHIKLSAAIGGLTQAEVDWFGRQTTKSTKTALTATTAVKIPAYLWKIRFAASQAGLAGASDSNVFLRSWTLDLDTGLTPQFYMDGNKFFGQTQESVPIAATLEMVVDSQALAVSEFYDKSAADTVDFIQLKALGPTLGGSAYSSTLQFAVLYEEPEIINGDMNGVNTYRVVSHLTYDPTWAQSISSVTVCSLTAL